ncbi:exo-beta-N-acetylmuramidase NamZ family protein [Gracilimonas sp.]|uniref:exo-beta-N-acetylmuramidase NamZ family protein n=1 Tax=Gracilimonas sp. TaxID=1974203 RepID=UPI003BA8BEF8
MKNISCLVLLILILVGCSSQQPQKVKTVNTGAEVLLDQHLDELEGKRVGLVMNPTSRVDGVHMVDTLVSLGVNVTALFAAEHGFRGEAGAGEQITDGVDEETGLPVFSLYGSTKKPTPEMLNEVDLLLFDLPDMGVRFYTYNSTMGLVMEAVAENDKELWILDRPNPLGGNYVAGWILREEYKSFVGSYPVPIAYGMTMGEIAQMAVGEQWLDLPAEPNYKVIKTAGWKRDMRWPDTGLPWIAPSPNLPSFEHAFIYPGTVIFEGTNMSEGRGTEDPFLTIGAPGFDFNAEELKELELKHSIVLDSVTFMPRSIPGKALYPKHEGKECTGIRISFMGDYDQTDPVLLGLDLLNYAQAHTPNFEMKAFANKLYGIDLKSIMENKEEIPSWQGDVEAFKEQRTPYLLY